MSRRGREDDKKSTEEFPGDPMVKNPPASAGDKVSTPGPGISHINPCTATTEHTSLEPVLCNRSHHNEESPPLSATRKSLSSNKDPAQPKIKILNKKKKSTYLWNSWEENVSRNINNW